MEINNVNRNSGTDVMKSVEDVTDRAASAQVEKNLFLGEYKERIIKALTFEEIKEKGIYYEIEEALDNNNMIEKAEVFYTIDGILSAKIKQRDPIARVYEDKEAYYMDSKGKKMPLSSVFSARVPLVRGHSSKYWDTTFLLMTFIKEDKWLRENITEVQVLPNGEYSFLMRVPHFKVFFGKFENEHLKIANLKAFYKQLEKTDALDNYSSVSLKYKNQVICKQ